MRIQPKYNSVTKEKEKKRKGKGRTEEKKQSPGSWTFPSPL